MDGSPHGCPPKFTMLVATAHVLPPSVEAYAPLMPAGAPQPAPLPSLAPDDRDRGEPRLTPRVISEELVSHDGLIWMLLHAGVNESGRTGPLEWSPWRARAPRSLR